MRRALATRLPLAVLGAAALACGGVTAEAEETVKAYNRALIEAYRLSDAAPLASVATEKEIRKVHALIDLKKASRLVLESELESLEVVAVRPSGAELMEVETREVWRYHDRSLVPGTVPGPEIVAAMSMRYYFVQRQGRWLMDQGRTLANEILEPEGTTLDPHRPHASEHADEPGRES